MTVLNQIFLDDDGYEPIWGDTCTVVLAITSIPSGSALSKMYLTVKRRLSDLDAAAALQLTITSASTAAGQITDDGSGDQTGAATFTISGASDYSGIDAGREYYYDIKYITDNAEVKTIEEGRAKWRAPSTLSIT